MVRLTIFLAVWLLLYCTTCLLGQATEPTEEREVGLIALAGLNKPTHITPVSTQSPIGVEFRYSHLSMRKESWEQCQCFFRSGFFVNAYSFRNPDVLGRSIGAGLFYEPILVHTARWGLSIRALAGITYVSRSYDVTTNPGNVAFGTPINGLIGAGLYARYNVASNWRLLVGFDYKHISNAGVRLPNQGLNIPSLAFGIQHYTGSIALPNPAGWRTTKVNKRWMFRVLALASVKVMEATSETPERGYPIYGLNLLAGYHLTRTHVVSGGIELLDDHYFKEQIKQWTDRYQPYQQGTLLAGYEYWQGHFSFTAHMGWNVARPLWYKPATYQKYGLLYRFDNGFTGGVVVKAYGDNTKNFQAVAGMTL
ncbi:acyloxyacyl hydrolase [Spirosoma pollinicola]|uniref:Acyloxyacyl hydrolase n=1 Tax=Spirosoma pollinicola TaxID=2057025 RepID=A0A2K8Z3K2_9BACT|nr:acyloxyacyl hydrolase [Spirosoma pollinicola]AUD04453.1 acyloxyacyl hydrolase [Spirosoma pollinicola]